VAARVVKAAAVAVAPDVARPAWVRLFGGIAPPGLVVGHYQPLADDGAMLLRRPTMPALCSRFRKRSEADSS